jgi:uncharacterized Zn finger protein (UPF0148 family)
MMFMYECGCTLPENEGELFCPTHCTPYIYAGEDLEDLGGLDTPRRESFLRLLSDVEDEFWG